MVKLENVQQEQEDPSNEPAEGEDCPGVDTATVREMSAETKDEIYCISLLMLYHCGLIYLPQLL